MMRFRFLMSVALLLCAGPRAYAQGPGERPPANVATVPISRGTVAPHTTFIGTVTYPEIAEVAAEASGLVSRVDFEEGRHLGKGHPMVTLDATVLRKEIEALETSQLQAATEAKQAQSEEERFKLLFSQATISPQQYENRLYAMEVSALKADALAAQVDALRAQLAKKVVYAPFTGVVMERRTDPGEWVGVGTVVAELGRDDEVDILVNVSGAALDFVRVGMEVGFEAGGAPGRGRVEAIIPKGDVRTRTFPVKIRAPNRTGLLDGMEAAVQLPTGPRREGFLVPRDALVTVRGRQTLFTVSEEGTARAVPVEVTGYEGRLVGVVGEGLAEGTPVVTKGQERLQDGQPVRPVP